MESFSCPMLLLFDLNLKARFAHLCTVMSRMHHRREGYPFGSLVDFAPDPMGRKSFCSLYLSIVAADYISMELSLRGLWVDNLVLGLQWIFQLSENGLL